MGFYKKSQDVIKQRTILKLPVAIQSAVFFCMKSKISFIFKYLFLNYLTRNVHNQNKWTASKGGCQFDVFKKNLKL